MENKDLNRIKMVLVENNSLTMKHFLLALKS